VGQLVLFCVLAVCCLAMIVVAASRLILMRRPAGAPDDLPNGPTWPEPSGEIEVSAIPAAGARPVPPRPGVPGGRPTPFLWLTAPAGRHAVSRGQSSAPDGCATGSPASGPGEA
jgi:hypothetical protein